MEANFYQNTKRFKICLYQLLKNPSVSSHQKKGEKGIFTFPFTSTTILFAVFSLSLKIKKLTLIYDHSS